MGEPAHGGDVGYGSALGVGVEEEDLLRSGSNLLGMESRMTSCLPAKERSIGVEVLSREKESAFGGVGCDGDGVAVTFSVVCVGGSEVRMGKAEDIGIEVGVPISCPAL